MNIVSTKIQYVLKPLTMVVLISFMFLSCHVSVFAQEEIMIHEEDTSNTIDVAQISQNEANNEESSDKELPGEEVEELNIENEPDSGNPGDEQMEASTSTENTDEEAAPDEEPESSEGINGPTASTSATSTSTTTDVMIETGETASVVSAVNVVNVNIFDSNGLFLLLNNLFGGIGSIDIRSLDIFNVPQQTQSETSNSDTCEDCEESSYTQVGLSNNVSITNTMVVRSQTGGNTITTDGDGSITTGNAYAAADLINIANTNIIDSNYLLMVVDNVGDWDGNLILPSAYSFNNLFSSGPNSNGSGGVSLNNTANISNNVQSTTETGSNKALGESATIETGDAVTGVNVVNQVNQNLIDTDSLVIMFRVFGNWAGQVYGAPDGLVWSETGDGVMLMQLPTGSNGTQQAQMSNGATIHNNVQMIALTGDNKVSAGESAEITTGNAYAAANIINVANTNVVGRNWMLAIINIFGDWFGNICFGQPDLWVAASADMDSDLQKGSEVTFTYTVTNNGDADVTNVNLVADFDSPALEFEFEPNEIISLLRPGETREIQRRARVMDTISGGGFVTNTVSVRGTEPDADEIDNTDVITLTLGSVTRNTPVRIAKPYESFEDPQIEVSKTASTSLITPGSTIDYTVKLYNDSDGPAYNSKLIDHLYDPNGEFLQEQGWDLGTIQPHEDITISYTVTFGETAQPGAYTNTAILTATANSDNLEFKSADVTVMVEDPAEEIGEVLGASTCEAYIHTYIRPGFENDPVDVSKLQAFLRHRAGYPSVSITGQYDLISQLAVKDFQEKYASEILEPWGMSAASGYVYYTTQKKINEVNCGDGTDFPLSYNQQEEIYNYRNRRLVYRETPIVAQEDLSDKVIQAPKKDLGSIPKQDAPISPIAEKSRSQLSFFEKIKNTVNSFFSKVFAWEKESEISAR